MRPTCRRCGGKLGRVSPERYKCYDCGKINRIKRLPILYPLVERRKLYPDRKFSKKAGDVLISSAQPHQLEFHNNTARVRFLIWGVGSGKSQTCAVEAGCCATRWPGDRGVIVAKSYPVLLKTVVPSMIDLDYRWKEKFGTPLLLRFKKTPPMQMTFVNGSVVDLLPADDATKLRGPNYRWCWIEEAATIDHAQSIMDELLNRFRMFKDWRLFGSTSPLEGAYIPEFVEGEVAKGNKDYWVSRYSTAENKLVRPEHIQRLKDTLSEWKYRRDVLGEDVGFDESIFMRDFSAKESIVKFDVKARLREPEWQLYAMSDWGSAQCHMVMLMQNKSRDIEVVVHDWHGWNKGEVGAAKAMYMELARLAKEWGYWPVVVYDDPTGQAPRKELRRLLRRHKVEVRNTWNRNDRDILQGVEMVKSRLKAYSGKRHLFFAQRLQALPTGGANGTGILRGMALYKWRTDNQGNMISKPFDDNKVAHAVDCLRYFYINASKKSSIIVI